MKSVYRIIEFNDNCRIIIRNHWAKDNHFQERFIITIGVVDQDRKALVYRFGIFNIAICLIKG